MAHIYEMPDSVAHMFSSGWSCSYRVIDYTIGEMDNIQSMQFFLDYIGATDENIIEDSGTQVILCHPDYPQHLCIDSGGLGDFFSHGFDVSEVDTVK